MEDEAVSALREIARLLERRVEQHDEQTARSDEARKRSEEVFAGIKEKQELALPKLSSDSSWRAEQEKRSAEMDEMMQRSEQRQEETLRFQERLLEELERHNRLLERLVEKLGG